MRPIRERIADSLEDRQLVCVVKRFKTGQGRMQTCLGILAERKHLSLGDGDVAAGCKIIAIMFQGYDSVETVVAADELHQHQHMIIVGSPLQAVQEGQMRKGVDLEASQKGHRRHGSYKVSTSHEDIVKCSL